MTISPITVTDGTTTVTLSPYLLWPDRYNQQRAGGSDRVTLGRRLVVTRRPGNGGNSITLAAINDNGRLKGSFTWGQASQLRVWADAGTILTLSFHGELFLVVIPLTGINLTPVVPKTNQPTEALCSGTVQFLET